MYSLPPILTSFMTASDTVARREIVHVQGGQCGTFWGSIAHSQELLLPIFHQMVIRAMA